MRKRYIRLIAIFCAAAILLGFSVGTLPPTGVSAATSSSTTSLNLNEDVKFFGRTYEENGAHHFSWSNSGFQFSFYGTGATATLKADLSTDGSAKQTAYVKVYVDGKLTADLAVPETETEISLASGLAEGQHTIKVIKRTSGYYSSVAVSQIQLSTGGEVRQTQMYFEKKMLFIGDDLVDGYGAMVTKAQVSAGNIPSYTTATEDGTITYTALAAEHFGAENMTVALTGGDGRGIVQNGKNTTTHTAPRFFEYLDYRNKRTVAYDHSQYAPDVIVINLGSFDSEAGVSAEAFEIGCRNFIRQVRAAYPDAKILYTYGFLNTTYASTIQAVISELRNAGDAQLYYQALTTVTSAEKGLGGRPTKEAHAARSKELIAAVERITEWPGADEVLNPVSDNVDSSYTAMDPTDITVMSYNVLAHNNSEQRYEHYSTRMAKAVTIIKAYDPDVIGLQEAAGKYDSYTHDWPVYLSSNMSQYSYVRLVDQVEATGQAMAQPGNGLVIMYKKDRFTLLDKGFKNLVTKATVDGITDTNNTRWFHWVKLKDNQTGSVFYLYNTHLTLNPTSSKYTDEQKEAFGALHRSMQCQAVADHIASTSKATKCPFFLTGDFNTSFSDGKAYLKTEPEKSQLYKLLNYTSNGTVYDFFYNVGQNAPFTRFLDYMGDIDHIFYNSRYLEVKEAIRAAEGVDGRRTSDHPPLVAYFNYKGNAQISGVDAGEKEFHASTSESKYTFDISVGTNVKYDVYKGSTKVGTGSSSTSVTVDLNFATNRFGICFKDGHGNPTGMVTAIITNTSISQPKLKATGSVVNSYFENGAYHVLVDGDVLNLATSSGRFYTNPFASRGASYTVVLTSISAGRSVYYLKSSIGDVYPVYIYKQTAEAAADSSVLYVDDDIGSAEGTVAFYNGTDVTFVTSGTNGFSTVAAAVEKANTINGSTVYFAPGHYSVNTTANEVIFTKDVTLLGNNHDVSAVEIKSPNWAQAGRKAESVIDGSFVFEAKGDISVTVKGFTLEGTSVQGPIYINDPAGAATRAKHLQTVDVQNNIITGSSNGQGSIPATVSAYSGAMVTGVVKNNYFRCTANQFAVTNGYTRATAFKNANELTLEGNFFIGYEVVNVFTGHVSDSVAGYCRYSVVGNRFEHCGTSRNYVKGITTDTSAYILYNNNDFVRSGGSGYDTNYAIDFIFDENALPNDFSNIKISVLRNNFYDCFRSLQFSRAANTKQKGNMAEMVLKVKANNFIQPTEGKWSKFFHSIRFSFLVDTTYTHNVSVPDTMWDFAQNTFESKYLDMEDLPGEDATNPAFNYVYNKVTYNGVSDDSFELTAKHFK